LITAVTLVALGFVAGSALANNWLTSNAKKAGDRDVYFWQCNLNDTVHDHFHHNDAHDIDPTDISTHLAHDCDIRDVGVEDATYGLDDPQGFYHCHELHSADVCDKGEVHINLSYPKLPEDPDHTRSVVCEEIGHSVGLGHRSDRDSCMKSPSADSDSNHLDGHDKGHLDNHY